jgi:hypothetical protein
METLKTSFRLNGLPYTLLKRNEIVALYDIGGEHSDKIMSYEVDIIYIRKDKYGEREHIPSNDEFGRDRSRCFKNKAEALKYFDILTVELRNERNLSQGVSKSIAGVEEDTKVVLEYQMA